MKLEPFSRDYTNTNLYKALFDSMRPDSELIWAVLEVLKPNVVIEQGAGSGRLLPYLQASEATRIIGLDIEPLMVEAYAKQSVKAEAQVADIRQINSICRDADLLIMTSSVMKHIPPEDRTQAWNAIFESVSPQTTIFLDHCPYIYGQENASEWKSYFETFRYWWPEEKRTFLKEFFWRKEVQGEQDILYYRSTNDQEARVLTYVYPLDTIKADIQSAGFSIYEIADNFPGAKALPNSRLCALLTPQKSDKTESLAQQVFQLAFGNCQL